MIDNAMDICLQRSMVTCMCTAKQCHCLDSWALLGAAEHVLAIPKTVDGKRTMEVTDALLFHLRGRHVCTAGSVQSGRA